MGTEETEEVRTTIVQAETEAAVPEAAVAERAARNAETYLTCSLANGLETSALRVHGGVTDMTHHDAQLLQLTDPKRNRMISWKVQRGRSLAWQASENNTKDWDSNVCRCANRARNN